MNKGIIAILKFYANRWGVWTMIHDCEHDILGEHTTRDGRTAYWYYDGNISFCVDTDGNELDEKEIEEQLL